MAFLSPFIIRKVTNPIARELFGNSPIVDVLPQPDMWCLDVPLVYYSALKNTRITCPKGGVSDLASTPKFLQWIGFLDDDGISRPAGIVHDLLYKLGRDKGKKWADEVLREMCNDLGMKRWQSFLYYYAVRIFGSQPWIDDGAMEPYGFDVRKTKFDNKADYDAWMESGGNLFS